VNLAEQEVRDRIRQEPKAIQVNCPHDHYITHMWLHVPDADPDAISMQPRGPSKWTLPDPRGKAGDYGARAYTSRQGGRHMVLRCRKCRYYSTPVCGKLAMKLAVHALAGHTKYQMPD
jgi:hypothetical protein